MPTRLSNTCTRVNVDVDMPKIVVSWTMVPILESKCYVRREKTARRAGGERQHSKQMESFMVLRDSSLRATVFSRAIVPARTPWNRG